MKCQKYSTTNIAATDFRSNLRKTAGPRTSNSANGPTGPEAPAPQPNPNLTQAAIAVPKVSQATIINVKPKTVAIAARIKPVVGEKYEATPTTVEPSLVKNEIEAKEVSAKLPASFATRRNQVAAAIERRRSVSTPVTSSSQEDLFQEALPISTVPVPPTRPPRVVEYRSFSEPLDKPQLPVRPERMPALQSDVPPMPPRPNRTTSELPINETARPLSETLITEKVQPLAQLPRKISPLKTDAPKQPILPPRPAAVPPSAFTQSTPLPPPTPRRPPVTRLTSIIPDDARERYTSAFAKFCTEGDTFMTGHEVRQVWLRSGLSKDILGKIWMLVDANEKSKLCLKEFIVGMYLVDLTLSGEAVPNQLRTELKIEIEG